MEKRKRNIGPTKKRLIEIGIDEGTAIFLSNKWKLLEIKNFAIRLTIDIINLAQRRDLFFGNRRLLRTFLEGLYKEAPNFKNLCGGIIKISKNIDLNKFEKILIEKSKGLNPNKIKLMKKDFDMNVKFAEENEGNFHKYAIRILKQTDFLKSCSFSNFKGFKNAQEISIRPLTLIYGPNNGGKSSILKGFGSMAQTTIGANTFEGNEEWSPKGQWYDLGSYPQILNNLTSKEFSISHTFEISREINEPEKYRKIEYVFKLTKKTNNEESYDGLLKISDQKESQNKWIISEIKFFSGEFEDYVQQDFSLRDLRNEGRSKKEGIGRDSDDQLFDIEIMSVDLKNSEK